MKRLFVVSGVVASFLLAGSAGAVEKEVGKGSAALLFTFSGLANMQVGSYGGGFGGKYFVTPNIAVRGTLALQHAASTDAANPGTGETGVDGQTSATRFGLGVGGEYHLAMGRISPYVGAALSFAMTSTSSKPSAVGAPPAPAPTTENNANCEFGHQFCAGTTLGVAALAGVEFFPFEHVALGAEYQLGYASTSRSEEKYTVNNRTTTTKVGGDSAFGIESTGLLTLTVYFM